MPPRKVRRRNEAARRLVCSEPFPSWLANASHDFPSLRRSQDLFRDRCAKAVLVSRNGAVVPVQQRVRTTATRAAGVRVQGQRSEQVGSSQRKPCDKGRCSCRVD